MSEEQGPQDPSVEESSPEETSVEIDPEGSGDPPKEVKGRVWPWILLGFMVLLLLGALGAGIYYLRGALLVPEGSSNSTSTPPKCPPLSSGFQWIEDVNLVAGWRLNLYSGLVTFNRTRTICGRISRADQLSPSSSYLIHINNGQEEAAMDAIIRANKDRIFNSTNPNRLLWTGMYFYGYNRANRTWENNLQKDRDGRIRFTNFCNSNWTQDLMENYVSDPFVFVVKDYRGNRIDKDHPACWQLLGKKQLAEQMGQRQDSDPRLHFVCSSRISNVTGQVAVPGHFQPKVTDDDEIYTVYGVTATYAEALDECRAHKGHLATVDTQAKFLTVSKLLERTHSRLRSALPIGVPSFTWTGGYYDEKTPGPPYRAQWTALVNGSSSSTWWGASWCSMGHNQTAVNRRVDEVVRAMRNETGCDARPRLAVLQNGYLMRVQYFFSTQIEWQECWELLFTRPAVEDPDYYVLCEMD